MSPSLVLAIESLLLPMFVIAIILTLLVVARLVFRSTSRLEILIGILLIIISTTGLLLHGVSDHYTGVGFNEAAVFHIKHGLSGLGLGVLWPVLAVAGVIVVMMATLFEIGRRKRISRVDHGLPAPRKGIGKTMVAIYLMMLLINPALIQSAIMASHVAHLEEYSAHLQSQTVDVDHTQIKHHIKPRSFVYLYAESFEASFLDDARWPGLAPNMKKMEEDPSTLSLRNVNQAPSTGWTIAGMAASQCGFPAVASDFHAKTPANQGGLTCIGDLLSQAGYTASYMGGAHLAFADKGDFYRIHGFDRVRGGPELQEEFSERNLEESDWGLYDDDLFDLALEEFDHLSRQGKPFGLFMLTLDTHPMDGYENKHCKQKGRYTKDARFGMFDAVHCSDQLISDFIQEIRSRPGGEEVIIIVASDHLQLSGSTVAKKIGHEHERRNLWMAQGPGIEGLKIDRPATMFDIAPTLAQLLGIDVPALGLGRSLIDERPTLLEEMGAPGLYARLRTVFGGMAQARERITGASALRRFGISAGDPDASLKTDSTTSPQPSPNSPPS